MRKNCFLSFFFMFALFFSGISLCLGQNNQIENLLRKAKVGEEDSTKVSIYLEIGRELIKDEPSRARFYAEKSLELSKRVNYKAGIAKSLEMIALCFNKENEIDKAIYFHLESIAYFKELNDMAKVALAYNDIGIIEKSQSRYLSAKDNFLKAIQYYQEIGDKEGESDGYSNLGVVSRKQGNFQASIEYFIKSLKIYEDIQNSFGIATAKGNLANLYRDQNNYERALAYYFQAMELFTVLDDKFGVGSTLNNIGITYKIQKKYKEALSYYQQSLEIFEEMDWQFGVASCYSNIGSIYNDQMDYVAALESNSRALKIFAELDNKEAVSGRYSEIGSLYTKLGQYEKAYPNLLEGLKLAKQIGNKGRELESYKELHEYYLATNNFKASLDHYKRFSELKDSIFNIEKSQQLAEIQTKYEIDKKEQENELLRKEQAVINTLIDKKDFENKVLISGVFIFLVFTGYFYFHNVQKKKINKLLSQQNDEINIKQAEIIKINADLQNSQSQLYKANKSLHKLNIGLESLVKERTAALQQINDELDTFLYQSSHALRRPIVTVMGLLQIARMEKSKKSLVDIYNKIDNTTNRMDLMLRKLVMVSEINFTRNEPELIDFEVIINEIWSSLSRTLNSGEMQLKLSVNTGFNFIADRKLIFMMLENLIENSIMYHIRNQDVNPYLEIVVSSNTNNIVIKLKDNGIGIPEQAINKVFDMFTIANDTGKGFGLGLYIVKKSVQKLRGSITVKSKVNNSTSFSIVLPKQNMSIG